MSDNKFTISAQALPANFSVKPSYNITFYKDDKSIGALDFNGPAMVFTGDMEESAKLFFGLVAAQFAGRLADERASVMKEGGEPVAGAATGVVVPDGYVLVPLEATDEMVDAAWESDAVDYIGEHKRIVSASDAYKVMVVAAAEVPK